MLGDCGVYGRMKRTLLLPLLLISSMFTVFAATSDPACRAQNISGFIDDISFLYVTPYKYNNISDNGYEGINLDYTDTTNSFYNLIKPTEGAPFSHPGVVIANFSLLSTFVEAAASGAQNIPAVKLTIIHDKLTHTTDQTDEGKLDYELAVLYTVNGGETEYTSYCYSNESETPNKIEIDLNQYAVNNMVSIQEGNIYFRFANGVAPTVVGQYESRITFILEGK